MSPSPEPLPFGLGALLGKCTRHIWISTGVFGSGNGKSWLFGCSARSKTPRRKNRKKNSGNLRFLNKWSAPISWLQEAHHRLNPKGNTAKSLIPNRMEDESTSGGYIHWLFQSLNLKGVLRKDNPWDEDKQHDRTGHKGQLLVEGHQLDGMDHILPPSGPLPLQKEEEKRFLRVGQTNIEQRKTKKQWSCWTKSI